MLTLNCTTGCELNLLDAESNSALHLVSAKGDVSLMRLLLDRGATVDIRGWEEATPLHVGIRHPDVVNLLLHRRADVHARNSAQETPLHLSASTGSVRMSNLNLFFASPAIIGEVAHVLAAC